MQTESVNTPVAGNQMTVEDELADFSTNRRVLLLSAMSLVIGAFSALVAYILIWLIAAITSLAFYHRFSAAPALPQGNHLGYWVVLVPVVGALIIGLVRGLVRKKFAATAFPKPSKPFCLVAAASRRKWQS